MSRFFIWCGSILLASVFFGGCYSASHHYQRSFPNMIGYTYPNWCGPPLITPPNGPTDYEAYAYLMEEKTGSLSDKTGSSSDTVSVLTPSDGIAP